MARKSSGIHTANLPPATDDFSLISGIGPVLAKRLHDAGICTYHQLASLSPEDISIKAGGISIRLISRQDWIGQAQKLEVPKIQRKHHSKKAPKRTIRQYYENFTIEILLNEKKFVRRIRAIHVQSGEPDTWAGWKPDQLIDFIARHTGIHTPARKKEGPKVLRAPHQANNNILKEAVSTTDDKHISSRLLAGTIGILESSNELENSSLKPTEINVPSGTLYLRDFKLFAIDSVIPISSLHQGEPYRGRITLDLTNVVVPSNFPLTYKAIISLKQLGGPSFSVIEECNTIQPSVCITLDMTFTSPPPGLYRPEAIVKLFPEKTALGLMAYIKGDLIQVL